MRSSGPLILLMLLLAGVARAAEDYCFDCHSVQEGMSLIFREDVHYSKGLSCADCHGGDPRINDMNKSKLPGTGFKLRATRQNLPDYCGRCHSDPAYMARHNPMTPTNQVELFRQGVHGKALATGNTESANCRDCHSVHDARAVRDPLATVSPRQMAGTCGKCHEAITAAYRDSPHGPEFRNRRRPGCVTCHAPHDTAPAETVMLTGPNNVCARCHKPGSAGIRDGVEIARLLGALERSALSAEAQERLGAAVHTFDPAAVRRAVEAIRSGPAAGGE